jgi:hypothetical protein
MANRYRFDDLRNLITENEGKSAESSIDAFFFKNAFTGSAFEKLIDVEYPNYITSKDLIAVSMLGVDIPATAARWILGEGKHELSSHLSKIDPHLTISDLDTDLTNGSPAWLLFSILRSCDGLGRTITSKILAAKRPCLIPIYDQHVAAFLGFSKEDYWNPWHEFMQSPEGHWCGNQVSQLAAKLGIHNISHLRLLDVVIWMKQHGHKQIDPELVRQGKMKAVNY